MSAVLQKTRETLLHRPVLIDGRAAALRVLAKRHNGKPAQMHWRLDELRASLSIRDLFRTLFPEDYAKLTPRKDPVDRFFNVLGFEVDRDFMINAIEEGDDVRNYSIPILSINPLCEDDYHDPEEVGLIWRLALALNRPRGGWLPEESALRCWQSLQSELDLPEELMPTGWVNPWRLYEMFEKARGPLRFMPAAMRVSEYNAGTIFFDYSDDMGDPDIHWSPENIKYLRAEWKKAQEISAQVQKLWTWFKVKQREKVIRALKIYRKAQREPKAGKITTVDQGQPLIRVFQ